MPGLGPGGWRGTLLVTLGPCVPLERPPRDSRELGSVRNPVEETREEEAVAR